MGGRPDLDTARQLFAQGRIGELVARSDCRPHALAGLHAHHQLVLAHALVLNGRPAPARAVATRHTARPASPAERSRAHSVLMLCAQLDGDVPSSLFHAEAATVLAEQSGDERRTVWAHLGLLRLQVDTGPGAQLESQFERTGRLAGRLPWAQALAYFHDCAAVADGQQGRLTSAWQHCATAESLLARDPNLVLQGTLLLNRSCLRCLNGDYEGALADLGQAETFILRSGLARSAAALQNNRAHLELMTGRLAAARRSFSALSRNRSVSRYVRIGALDGLARTHLAAGALAQCEAELDHAERSAEQAGLDVVYHVRWAAATRVRALLARGRAGAALDRARRLDGVAAHVGDPHLQATAALLAARAQHQMGQRAEAARSLLRAAGLLDSAPQLHAEYCHHAAVLVADRDPAASRMLRTRAHQLWHAGGATGVRAEVEQSDLEPQDRRDQRRTHAASSPLAVALAAAACVDDGNRPGDSARALATLASSLGLDANAGTLPSLQDATPADAAHALALSAAHTLARAAQPRGTPAVATTDRAGEPAHQDATEMDRLRAEARRIATTDASVLITGETGTGKDMLARFIHEHSAGAGRPFVPFNCAAVARELFDSQLFGHCKGAFTGAADDAQGVVRAAAGGTLFLDEIGEMGLDIQPKLLRFLESGEVHPIGATQAVTVRVRVIAATNANLEAMMADGRFRADLYYRLGIVRFRLPPLRARRADILPLARRFLRQFATRYGKGTLTLDDAAAACLWRYAWPGNVRQLLNEMKRVAALADAGITVGPDALSPELRDTPPEVDTGAAVPTVAAIMLAQPVRTAVEALERAQVAHALKVSAGHAGRAAGLLGLSRKGLYLKRRRYHL